ncbi:MAG TPA: hypothetical protein PKH65_01575 [Bacteroidia bacterium]|nr:hypothetical protein [Bacteroidia bacterium]HNT79345.1 hypothetical protein [Bacteroidia bacterium]
MKKSITLFFLSLFCISGAVYAQGCSDAGFCSAGSMQNHNGQDEYVNLSKVSASISYGVGEQGVSIVQFTPEVQIGLFTGTQIQVKIPFMAINGNIGSNSGLGDAIFSITQKLPIDLNDGDILITAGSRIPIGTTDEKDKDGPLPMPYQTGLGTLDGIGGLSVRLKQWKMSAGFQWVMDDQNKNQFLRAAWLGNEDAQKYFESNKLKRGNDALLRIDRSLKVGRFVFTPGVLGIYRLNKDSYVNENGVRSSISGSDGLTLNINLSSDIKINDKAGLNVIAAFPAVVRDKRPDGLTRSAVLSFTFSRTLGN